MASLSTRVTFALAWLVLVVRAPCAAEDDVGAAAFDPTAVDRVDLIMNFDPQLEFPPDETFISTAPKPLWVRALARGDAQLQRVTVDTIALAHRRGMEGLEDLVPTLIDHLQQPDLHPQLLYALCAALIEFDAQAQAELLAQQSQANGQAMKSLVEPALARWHSPALSGEWLRRLDDPATDRMSMLHAIEGLAALSETNATAPLLRIIFDAYSPPNVRMSAARAVGKIHASELESEAKKLAEQADSEPLAGLMAVAMLSQHDSDAAIEVLQSLVGHESTSVQSGALGRLFAIDPNLVIPHAEAAIASIDVNVRRLGARAMITLPQVDRIASLSSLLDDVNPDLRREVASALVHLAKQDDLRDEVIKQASAVLGRNAWRGCEQAAVVLVNLDHKPAGDRLVDLMSHERFEVMVTSAWGLRRLAIAEHLPAMLEQAKSVLVGFRNGQWTASMFGPELQITQLFMAFGQMGYHPAEELMREYIPKSFTLGDNARPAAVWGLGLLHEGKATEELTGLFLDRMNDVSGEFPEMGPVRRMAAVSIGRMRSESAVPELRKFAFPQLGTVGLASLWAIEQMTGEKPPPLIPDVLTYEDWFLGPVNRQTE